MSRPPALTKSQKQQFSNLRKQLFEACRLGDVLGGRTIVSDIRRVLLKTGHNTKYYEMLLHYSEMLINIQEYSTAQEFLEHIISKTNDNRRLCQESHVLLAICKLHEHDLESAEKHIRLALSSTAIKNVERRKVFLERVGERIEEEALVASFPDKQKNIEIETDEFISLVQKYCMENLSEIALLEEVGKAVPPTSVDFMQRIHEIAKKQLSFHEQKMLPAPPGNTDFIEIGKRFLTAASRKVWPVLCPEDSKLHKTIDLITDPEKLVPAIFIEIAAFGLPVKTFVAALTTLIIRHGVDKYCLKYEPQHVMSHRNKK